MHEINIHTGGRSTEGRPVERVFGVGGMLDLLELLQARGAVMKEFVMGMTTDEDMADIHASWRLLSGCSVHRIV